MINIHNQLKIKINKSLILQQYTISPDSIMLGKSFELSLKLGRKIVVEAMPHISQGIVQKVQQCKKFQDYISKIDNTGKNVEVDRIQIVHVEMFGEKVGFVSLRTQTKRQGFKLPGFVFLRGPSVAILMFVNKKLLVVEQYRVPIQSLILQAPAGMLDESGDFVGVAASEIQEETSIKINSQKLVSLGSFYPSVGGSDQELIMFLYETQLGQDKMKEVEEKVHGEGDCEKIKVKFLDYTPENIIATKDSKLMCLMYAYESMKKSKL